jgi:hypothetical protein
MIAGIHWRHRRRNGVRNSLRLLHATWRLVARVANADPRLLGFIAERDQTLFELRKSLAPQI